MNKRHHKWLMLSILLAVCGCTPGEGNSTNSDVHHSDSDSTLPNSDSSDLLNSSIQGEPAAFSIETTVTNAYTYDESSHTYTITKAGDYVISGKLTGSLVFAASLDVKCNLDLNGVEITNPNGPAIAWLSESRQLDMKTVEGTINRLIEGAHSGTATSAAVLSENNLEIGGSGTLYIEGNYRHAVKGSDVVVKGTGKVYLTAQRHAIHAKSILVRGAEMEISDVEYGLSAERNSKGNKGTIDITAGVITIRGATSAIVSESNLNIGALLTSDPWPDINIYSCSGEAIVAGGTLTLTNANVTVDDQPYTV